ILTGTPPKLVYTPNLNFYGSDRFTFTASDGIAASNTATVTITVTRVNHPPMAKVGSHQGVNAGDVVTLDGSGSSDPDGDPLVYRWTQVAGVAVALDVSDPVRPTFVAPDVPIGGSTLTFQLVVNGGSLGSAPASPKATVKHVHHAPSPASGR